MLSKGYRLRKPSEFRLVRSKGRCWSTPLLVVCKRENGLPSSRFGFSVSKRVGKAAARNRVKRRMREAVRVSIDGLVPGWDVVFIARPRIGRASYPDIESSVLQLLDTAGLIRPTEPSPFE